MRSTRLRRRAHLPGRRARRLARNARRGGGVPAYSRRPGPSGLSGTAADRPLTTR
ncbi:hypothetical protein GZL_07166 [Streptomyces sp. 769]|nr:hypothetical protein GZL_07166 [Streptomyces sp. 769]